ncbi:MULTISPECIES: RagB/SusD family nutrient uptake outer membrane protein [Butyricimonas]|uniref:RagB/SusD family nutrient uptake outer membrane protein n=1 Tax=Butyricimonas TaxID=574697 RepID=UPI0007FB5285|nr:MULTISPECIES: RagB/SusD family nutrient uptake outer membrane protein [Butyricimonas]
MKVTRTRYFDWLLVAMLALACSCSDWLDVNPRTEMKEEDMYQSEKGFKNVMNGIYIQLAAKELYGKNTSYYFPDLLAGYWYKTSNTTETYIASFNYSESNVESVIQTIWSKYYTVVAHINDLLENLEKTDVQFSYGNKELLLGEAYGLRAFIHLELLRLFGPVPAGATDDMVAIPYVTEITREPSKLVSVSYGKVKENILKDLEQAEKYLQEDPFALGNMFDFNNPGSNGIKYTPDDDWHYYRQTHFNRYAVDALRARFYHWIGDGGQAAIYAKKVVEVENTDGTNKFELATEANSYTISTGKNLVMQCEHIFALNCSSLQKIINGVMMSSSTAKPKLYLTNSWVANVYEKSETDIRCRSGRYFEVDGTNAYYLKYYKSGVIEPINMVPLVRLAEMYLILVEDLPLDEAKGYFETYRQARGMDVSININSETTRKSQVEKEYRKEFWGEGQMFYYYKLHNITSWSIPQSVTIPMNGFVVPKPQGQTAFE